MANGVIDVEEIAREVIVTRVSDRLDRLDLRATININDLVEVTGISKTSLEENFVCTEPVKKIEERFGTKRLWPYPEIKKLWLEYLKNN